LEEIKKRISIFSGGKIVREQSIFSGGKIVREQSIFSGEKIMWNINFFWRKKSHGSSQYLLTTSFA